MSRTIVNYFYCDTWKLKKGRKSGHLLFFVIVIFWPRALKLKVQEVTNHHATNIFCFVIVPICHFGTMSLVTWCSTRWITGKSFSETMFSKKVNTILPAFSLGSSEALFGKVIKRREKDFYPSLFRNSLESWQKKLKYLFCEIINSEKNLPVQSSCVCNTSQNQGFNAISVQCQAVNYPMLMSALRSEWNQELCSKSTKKEWYLWIFFSKLNVKDYVQSVKGSITISSFTSICPSVCYCVDNTSVFHRVIRSRDLFIIAVLGEAKQIWILTYHQIFTHTYQHVAGQVEVELHILSASTI